MLKLEVNIECKHGRYWKGHLKKKQFLSNTQHKASIIFWNRVIPCKKNKIWSNSEFRIWFPVGFSSYQCSKNWFMWPIMRMHNHIRGKTAQKALCHPVMWPNSLIWAYVGYAPAYPNNRVHKQVTLGLSLLCSTGTSIMGCETWQTHVLCVFLRIVTCPHVVSISTWPVRAT